MGWKYQCSCALPFWFTVVAGSLAVFIGDRRPIHVAIGALQVRCARAAAVHGIARRLRPHRGPPGWSNDNARAPFVGRSAGAHAMNRLTSRRSALAARVQADRARQPSGLRRPDVDRTGQGGRLRFEQIGRAANWMRLAQNHQGSCWPRLVKTRSGASSWLPNALRSASVSQRLVDA
jgi:hypothetical protein